MRIKAIVQKSREPVEINTAEKEKCPANCRAKFQNKRILTRSPWVRVCVCSTNLNRVSQLWKLFCQDRAQQIQLAL
ncbi:hypothetical protein AKJ18_34565, partial [Vibrio xuii]